MGIRHLCDEKIKDDEFQYFIDNIGKFQVTEKVDGTNLTFGRNELGDLYINRDKKDGRGYGRVYYETRKILGTHFSKYMEILLEFLTNGAVTVSKNSEIEIEIIDNPITNVVPYDGHQIIVLNVVSGTVEINTQEINTALHGKWAFKMNRPYKIDYDAVQNLFKNNARQDALIEMKKLLLDIPSQYGTNNPKSWIEGLVFKSDDLIYKLVNKDRFTVMNKFLHSVQKKLSAPKPSITSPGGLYQEFASEIASHYLCGQIATSQRKKWKQENPYWQQIVMESDNLFYAQNLLVVKAIVEKYRKMLSEMKAEYLTTWQQDYIDTPYGKCYIDEYTHQRNLATFTRIEIKIGFVDNNVMNNMKSKDANNSIGLASLAEFAGQ